MGSLYKRGNTWWIKYYRNGKSFRESAGTDKKMVAKKLLDRREGEIAQGKTPGIQFDKVTFDELAEEFLAEYKINGRKSIVRAEQSVDHLKGYFTGYKSHIRLISVRLKLQPNTKAVATIVNVLNWIFVKAG